MLLRSNKCTHSSLEYCGSRENEFNIIIYIKLDIFIINENYLVMG